MQKFDFPFLYLPFAYLSLTFPFLCLQPWESFSVNSCWSSRNCYSKKPLMKLLVSRQPLIGSVNRMLISDRRVIIQVPDDVTTHSPSIINQALILRFNIRIAFLVYHFLFRLSFTFSFLFFLYYHFSISILFPKIDNLHER